MNDTNPANDVRDELQNSPDLSQSPLRQSAENFPTNLPRGILKTSTSTDQGQSDNAKESFKKGVSFKNVLLSRKESEDLIMMNQLLECKMAMLTVWCRHQSKCETSINYIPRVPIVFQPGMTARYIKFILKLSFDEDNTLNHPLLQNKQFVKFSKKLGKSKIDIITTVKDLSNVKVSNKTRVLVLESLNVEEISSFINKPGTKVMSSKLCIILSMKPIVGLNLMVLEKALKVKARPINLPRLTTELNLVSQYLKFDNRNYSLLAGIPKLLEENGLTTLTKRCAEYDIGNVLALWLQPEYKHYEQYYSTLIYYAMCSRDIYSYTMLDVKHSFSTVLNAALALGFEAIPSHIMKMKKEPQVFSTTSSIDQAHNSKVLADDLQSPTTKLPKFNNFTSYTLICNKTVKDWFHKKSRLLEYFKIAQKGLRWYEAEKTIATVMACYSQNDFERKLSNRFNFFKTSFVSELCPFVFPPVPAVLPQVTSDGLAFDVLTIKSWEDKECMVPMQPTMNKSDWHKVLSAVYWSRPLLPIGKSHAPDYSVRLKPNHLLCFQTQTDVQDSAIDSLMLEVSKSPYLDIQDNKLVREHPEVSITFVLVSMAHKRLKESLIQAQDNVKEAVNQQVGTEENKSEDSDESSEEKKSEDLPNELQVYDSHIHIPPRCAALPLPKNVEVIILRKPGLHRLFGIDSSETPASPRNDVKTQLKEDFGELTNEQLREKTRAFLTDAWTHPNGEKIIDELLKEFKKEKKGEAKKSKK